MISKFMREWFGYVIIIVVVILVRTYIVTPVIVRGDSMEDTLSDGEILFLSKISYKISSIERFDIVVIQDYDEDLIIKRVIGLPGDSVEYSDNVLYINGEAVDDVYAFNETSDFTLDDVCEIRENVCDGVIPEGYYLVLGDNREVSADSRYKGLFYQDEILGKVVFRLWPLSKIGTVL